MSAPQVFVARLLPEFARTEQDKSCHLFPVPGDGPVPDVLRAYCGFGISPGQAEQLEGPAGMPCVPCLMTAALAPQPENP